MNSDELDEETTLLGKDVDEELSDIIELEPLEYLEDWANISDAWVQLLNTHGEDGWRLRFVLIDEIDDKGNKHVGRRRLIFERIAVGEEAS